MLRKDAYNGSHDIFETDIVRHITSLVKSSTNLGRHHVTRIIDEFKHETSTGVHVCMTFEILGQHLGYQTAQFKQCRLPVRYVKKLTSQILQGLDFLHRECGIIHTDLQPSNILLELGHLEETISQYLSTTPPRLAATANREFEELPENVDPNVPLYEALPTPLLTNSEDFSVRIIDYGVASWVDRHLSDEIQPPLLRAPEVTLGAPWSTGVDIWSLGCLIIEFVNGHRFINPSASPRGIWTYEDDALAQMMELLGPFPADFLATAKRRDEFFDADGNLLRIPTIYPTNLERQVDGQHEVTKRPEDMPLSEVPIYVDFLRGIFVLDPAKRKTAAELLEHEWLRV
jgi:serine/threonine-protein kinase SRPK3